MNAGADSLAVYSSSPVAFDQAFDQLHEACIDGDIAQVRQLVEAGHHVNEMDCFSYTPLMRAAMFGSAEICTYLLQNGANLSLVDKNTFTPLMLSAMWGHPRALEVLIKHKAPLDCVDRKYHMTALMWAASNTACVKLLLNHGADLSLKDVKGRTARDRAVEKFRHEIVELITHEEGERKKGAYSFLDVMFLLLSEIWLINLCLTYIFSTVCPN